MGKKAKLKKARQQQKNNSKTNQQFDSTQFVKQFKKMGYQIPDKDKFSQTTDSLNLAPEIPQERIEPQL